MSRKRNRRKGTRGKARSGDKGRKSRTGQTRSKESSPPDDPDPDPGSWLDMPARTGREATARNTAVALAAGIMWVLASADFDIWPLAYVAIIPTLWLIDRAPTRRRAIAYGWLSGLSCNAVGFYWITELLTRHAAMPWLLGVLALLLLSAYQALVFAFFAAAVRGVRDRSAEILGRPLPMVLVAPAAMVAFEILVPFIFPWYLAISQAWVAPVIQIAELTGPVGITFVVIAVGAAVYDGLLEKQRRRRILAVAGAAGLVAAVLAFGYVRLGRIDARRAQAPKLAVGLVQSNIPLDRAYRRAPSEMLAELQRVSADLERAGAELLVWPESSYPYGIARSDAGDGAPDNLARIRRGFTVPLVLGALTIELEPEPGANEHTTEHPPAYNSAILLEADDRFNGRYDKIYRLMFGEYIPGVETFPFIRDLLPDAASHLSAGTRVTTFPFQHEGSVFRLGPIICYEDILPSLGRELAAQHPHLLVNITNDTWFGDTSEPWQHLALSVFRAVETRTELVRAVNTGVSAHVDAAGRVRARSYVIDPVTEPRAPSGHLVEVALLEGGHTVYARVGDLFGYLCVAFVIGLWFLWPFLWRRRSVRAAP